jgi:hypothetical protein
MLTRKMYATLLVFFTLLLLLPASVVISSELLPGEVEDTMDVVPMASAAHLVTNIALTPDTPNILAFGQSVNITFDYTTTEAGGVLIFARPMTGDKLTPHYVAHASPIYPVGTGTGSGSFSITSGNVTVNKIRFRIYNADQSQLLFQIAIPVHYKFR